MPELLLSFENEVLRRVDVLDDGIPSINGEHQVGESIEGVLDRYRTRIANGEELAVTCSDEVVTARARPAYRLAFFHSAGVVTRISSLDRGQLAEGGRCPDVGGVAIEHVATIKNATCALKEIIVGVVRPTCYGLVLGPSVDGYIAEIDGVTYAVAYGGVFTRSGMLEAMCRDLPHCPEAEFTEVPDNLLLSADGPTAESAE